MYKFVKFIKNLYFCLHFLFVFQSLPGFTIMQLLNIIALWKTRTGLKQI